MVIVRAVTKLCTLIWSNSSSKANTNRVGRLIPIIKMAEWSRHRFVRDPELRPLGVIVERVVRDVEGDDARAASEVERLLGIHRQDRNRPLVVDSLAHLTIADLDVVWCHHRLRARAELHLRRCPGVVQRLAEVVTLDPDGARGTPDRAIQLARAIASPCGGIERIAKCRIVNSTSNARCLCRY